MLLVSTAMSDGVSRPEASVAGIAPMSDAVSTAPMLVTTPEPAPQVVQKTALLTSEWVQITAT
jgi:hypothetical protein